MRANVEKMEVGYVAGVGLALFLLMMIGLILRG